VCFAMIRVRFCVRWSICNRPRQHVYYARLTRHDARVTSAGPVFRYRRDYPPRGTVVVVDSRDPADDLLVAAARVARTRYEDALTATGEAAARYAAAVAAVMDEEERLRGSYGAQGRTAARMGLSSQQISRLLAAAGRKRKASPPTVDSHP